MNKNKVKAYRNWLHRMSLFMDNVEVLDFGEGRTVTYTVYTRGVK